MIEQVGSWLSGAERLLYIVGGLMALGTGYLELWPRIQKWRKPLLLYVSWGGTCRDPMAKVITERHLGDRAANVRVLSAGARLVAKDQRALQTRNGGPSVMAATVVRDRLGGDPLGNYRIRRIGRRLILRAKLIVLFSSEFREDVQALDRRALTRTVVFDEFFQCDPIPNPWRADDHGDDDEAYQRYEQTYLALDEVLSKPDNLDKLYRRLTV